MPPPPPAQPKTTPSSSHASSSTPPRIRRNPTSILAAPTNPMPPPPLPPHAQRRRPSAGASSDPIQIDSDDDSDATMTFLPSDAAHHGGKKHPASPSSSFTPGFKPGNNKGGVKSLQQLAARSVFKDLQNSLQGQQNTAAYCCGGSLPISSVLRGVVDSGKGTHYFSACWNTF